jgi:hypothetical protein
LWNLPRRAWPRTSARARTTMKTRSTRSTDGDVVGRGVGRRWGGSLPSGGRSWKSDGTKLRSAWEPAPVTPDVEHLDDRPLSAAVAGRWTVVIFQRRRPRRSSRSLLLPEATAARKIAMAEKKAARGECSTPGCTGLNYRGRDKCERCLYH